MSVYFHGFPQTRVSVGLVNCCDILFFVVLSAEKEYKVFRRITVTLVSWKQNTKILMGHVTACHYSKPQRDGCC